MSIVAIILPVLSATMGGFAPSAGSAAVSLGFSVLNTSRKNIEESRTESVELIMENSEIIKEKLAQDKELMYKKDDIYVTFTANERGKCIVRVYGKGKSKKELSAIGESMINKVTQQYVFDRVVADLKKKGYTIVTEFLDDNKSVRLSVRRFSKQASSSSEKEEMDIEINDENKVSVHVKGMKGKSCVSIAEELVQLIGKEESHAFTSEYYQPDPSVSITNKQKLGL